MSKLTIILVVLLSIFAATNTLDDQEHCCDSCQSPAVRYYSIDHIFNQCGYNCLEPKYFWIYKIFEFGLTIETTPNPCQAAGYTEFKEHVVHGFWKIKADVDMYIKPKSL